MPLRRRISIVAAATVAIAVAIAVVTCYVVVRRQLVGQVDNELKAQAQRIESGYGALALSTQLPGNSANGGANAPYVQYVGTNGYSKHPQGNLRLPTGSAIRAVAAGRTNNLLLTVSVNGSDLRMYVFRATLVQYAPSYEAAPIAVELARPLGPVASILSTLKWILVIVFLLVVALAALLARFATRRVLTPLAEVTATAQMIGETDDLSQRIVVREDDEVGQLAQRFNEMLERLEASREALDASVAAQRQLVADASHELRTPVTSLRTNIEVLLADGVLDEEDRRRLLADVVEQSEELSALVADLIEVARGDMPSAMQEDTRLDRLVEEALDRAHRNAPDVEFTADLEPVAVIGNPERLSRAINNLLDNASRHTEPGTAVHVTVDAAGVTVRDHGDGIAEQDLPHIFDRFYRGENSRARQGSGLGLAIVRQVAEQHGGSISATNAADGGAVFSLSLPSSVMLDDTGVPSDTEVSA